MGLEAWPSCATWYLGPVGCLKVKKRTQTPLSLAVPGVDEWEMTCPVLALQRWVWAGGPAPRTPLHRPWSRADGVGDRGCGESVRPRVGPGRWGRHVGKSAQDEETSSRLTQPSVSQAPGRREEPARPREEAEPGLQHPAWWDANMGKGEQAESPINSRPSAWPAAMLGAGLTAAREGSVCHRGARPACAGQRRWAVTKETGPAALAASSVTTGGLGLWEFPLQRGREGHRVCGNVVQP